MKILFSTIILLTLMSSCEKSIDNEIDLSGEWQVKLDSSNVGEIENWADTKFQWTLIHLPGTLDDAGLGKSSTLKPEINNSVMSNLARKHQYIGKAWHQKEIDIPTSWKENKMTMSLERVLWVSTVYIDGTKVGSHNSLIGSRDFKLKNIIPGKHTLTIVIDNSNKFPDINVAGTKYPDKVNQDMAHAYTNHTQIKWNGILGEIILKNCPVNKPTNIQVYPSEDLSSLHITFDQPGGAENSVELLIKSANGNTLYKEKIKVIGNNDRYALEIETPSGIEPWDEFNPNLYDVSISTITGTLKTRFGRKFVSKYNGNLTLNGICIFLPVFWSTVHFPNQPATMGISVNSEHPIFNHFPTDSHTNWQWWDLCIKSISLVVDSLNVTPLVRVIDNFVTNQHI